MISQIYLNINLKKQSKQNASEAQLLNQAEEQYKIFSGQIFEYTYIHKGGYVNGANHNSQLVKIHLH